MYFVLQPHKIRQMGRKKWFYIGAGAHYNNNRIGNVLLFVSVNRIHIIMILK